MKIKLELLNRMRDSFYLQSRGFRGTEEILDMVSEMTGVQLEDVLERLDARFGEDYSKDHPDLVGLLVVSCAINFHAAITNDKLRCIQDNISALVL